MTRTAKHTKPTQNSHDAAYGHRYDGFGGSAQASHGVSWSHTVTESGSSAWITDGSGNACTERSRSVNQHLQYLPFGESFIDQRTNHDIRFKFTTKEEDSETGYQYFGARYYASDLSIWLSVDPIIKPNESPFSYCSGNPIMFVDPNGMDTILFNKKGEFGKPIKDDSDHDTYIRVKDRGENSEFKNNKINYKKNGKLRNRHKKMELTKGFYKSRGKMGNADSYVLWDYNTAKSVFEFFADNTEVEWGHAIGLKEGEGGSFNMITTSHLPNKADQPGPKFVSEDGYKIVELRHNHIQGYNYSKDDKEAYGTYIKANREIPMYIYQNYRYERFTDRNIFPNSNCPKSYQY